MRISRLVIAIAIVVIAVAAVWSCLCLLGATGSFEVNIACDRVPESDTQLVEWLEAQDYVVKVVVTRQQYGIRVNYIIARRFCDRVSQIDIVKKCKELGYVNPRIVHDPEER